MGGSSAIIRHPTKNIKGNETGKMLRTKTIDEFVNVLATSAPTPGGGSVAALDGALGVALLEMVCDLTVGKEKYREVWPDIEEIKSKLEPIRDELVASIDKDAEAFDMVTAAYKNPKSTPEEKALRKEAIQEALKAAADIPKSTAKLIHDALKLAMEVAEKGNPNVVSDAGVAAACLKSGLLSSIMNVAINMNGIKDEAYNAQLRKEIDFLRSEGEKLSGEVIDYVSKAIKLTE